MGHGRDESGPTPIHDGMQAGPMGCNPIQAGGVGHILAPVPFLPTITRSRARLIAASAHLWATEHTPPIVPSPRHGSTMFVGAPIPVRSVCCIGGTMSCLL